MWIARNKQNNISGFSLIELIITISMLAMVGIALLSVFSVGIKAYARVQDYGKNKNGYFIALEKIEQDLHNALSFSSIGFNGDSKKISFPLTADNNADLVKITYYLDAGKNLLRKQEVYTPSDKADTDDKTTALVNLADLVFSYYGLNDETGKFEWRDNWVNLKKLPKLVKVVFIYKNGEKNISLSRAILIPVSG